MKYVAINNYALIWMCLVIVRVQGKDFCSQGYNQLPQQGGINLTSNVLMQMFYSVIYSNIIMYVI